MYREVMAKKSATTRDVTLLLLTTIVAVDQVQRNLELIHVQTRTITNREHHLREVIIPITITVEEVLMFEVRAAEVHHLQDQVLAPVLQVQVEEINNHTHFN